jgi:hypothetical protein
MTTRGSDEIDRRDFMLASVGALGAAATLMAGAAQAQDAGAKPETGAGGTAFTGDIIDGKQVIAALDISDLEPGKPSV